LEGFRVWEPVEVSGEILGPVRVTEEIFVEELGHERRNQSVNVYKDPYQISLGNFLRPSVNISNSCFELAVIGWPHFELVTIS
jgi:hypothetical protein